MKFRKLPILPNIKDFSGASEVEAGYLISNQMPAFFFISANYSIGNGYIARLQNRSSDFAHLGILIEGAGTLIRRVLLQPRQTLDVYLPKIEGFDRLELFVTSGEIVLQNLELVVYEQVSSFIKCNSALYLRASANPAGTIKFSTEGISMICPIGQQTQVDISLLPQVNRNNLVVSKFNSPEGLQILNEFGLFDEIKGRVERYITGDEFRPPIYMMKLMPAALKTSVSSLEILIGTKYTSKLEEYLNA